jgi:uncharacterized membrane protein
MARRAARSLGRRADACGVLVAGTNVPLTFQRTLMPRSTVDQALVTGLSITTNQALVELVQESIQAGAFVVARRLFGRDVSERTWGRAAVALDAAAFATGLAIQRGFRQRAGEQLPHAAARTGGFWLSVTGFAGAVVGGVDEMLPRKSKRGSSIALALPVTAALAGAGEHQRRKRARLDVDMPSEESTVAAGKALAIGVGVAAGSSMLAAGERALAERVARVAARLLPGEVEMWRPLGHAVALSGSVAAGRFLTQKVFAQIESRQEAVETSFDIAPPLPCVSGHPESLVPFDTLAVQGRRFVWMTTIREMVEQVTGEAAAQPVRVYVGLQSAETEEERVDLALRELDRTGAFDREFLMVVSPTGTGYVNYAAVSALEFLSRGDCATVAMQYSARPSPLSLGRVSEGRKHMGMLLDGIRQRLADRPVDKRPRVVLFGESLGAWTSQDPFVGLGTQGLVDRGIDRAIWIGTPHFSKWKEQVLHDDAPEIDGTMVGVFNSIDDWRALPAADRDRIRYVMITHYDDGVAVFGPELTVQAPSWLGDADTRPPTVPKGMRWMPTTTFFQVLVDMKNAANVVPGVFAAKGHDYRADLLPFFDAALGFHETPERLDIIADWLETRELERSTWIRNHGHAEKSLSATIVERLLQRERDEGGDADQVLLDLVRQIAAEEFADAERPSTLSQFAAGDASPSR